MNEATVLRYVKFMEEGTMLDVNVAIMLMPNGKKYLCNGQKVLTAIVMHGKPHPAQVNYYRCDTEADAWELYGAFDTNDIRTEGHVMKAAKGLFDNKSVRDLPERILRNAGAALFLIRNGAPKMMGWVKPDSKTTKAKMVNGNPRDVLWYSTIAGATIKQGRSNPMTRVGVIAAMLMTRRVDEKQATDFWTRVSSGAMLEENDPRFRLSRWLAVPKKGGPKVQFYDYSSCVLWWNAWRNNEQRKTMNLATLSSWPEPV